jgi:hypothetical protein
MLAYVKDVLVPHGFGDIVKGEPLGGCARFSRGIADARMLDAYYPVTIVEYYFSKLFIISVLSSFYAYYLLSSGACEFCKRMPMSRDIPRAHDRQFAWFDQLCIPR